MAPPLPPLREVIRRHGLTADKKLGQHFLLDPSILRRVAAAADPLDGLSVLEVGPGPGGLTRALLATGAARVVAVEQDRRCVAALDELAQAAPGRLEIVHGDARRFDFEPLLADGPTAIVANLPYNVGTVLLLGWLARIAAVEPDARGLRREPIVRLVLMFQKEVAARLVARPGAAAWGRLGVLAQSLTKVERVFDLPASAFVPPPAVDSTLVRLSPLPERIGAGLALALQQVTRAAFGQRRKMLRAALRGLVPDPAAFLEAAGIAAERRAETLDIRELHALARVYAELRAGPPAQGGAASRNCRTNSVSPG
jgi:16S rRNA (adenine1518-N6/adenine1519-N6)-dimethyltransferase